MKLDNQRIMFEDLLKSRCYSKLASQDWTKNLYSESKTPLEPLIERKIWYKLDRLFSFEEEWEINT